MSTGAGITDSPPQTRQVFQAVRGQEWIKGVLLLAATLVAYLPCLTGRFLWDDASWTLNLKPLHQSFHGLWSMWVNLTALQQYYPLSGTTFWIDYQIWGFRTLPYHLENVLLHIAAVLLFWRILKQLRVPGALFAAGAMALHPICVESVAWITQRKNVLSMVLFLAAFWMYGRFADFWQCDCAATTVSGPTPKLRPNYRFYSAAFVLFLAAYLAKATVFAFPAVLLLVAWWKRGTLRLRQDVLPTLPFFLITIVIGSLVTWLERHHVGAIGVEWELSLAQRCLIAGRAVWFYVGKILWPATPCFIYPRWSIDPHSVAQWVWPVAAVMTLFALWALRHRTGRGPLTAALYFCGTLFPLLGFLNGYFMRYSFVNDHWCYLPCIGLLAGFGAALSVLGARLLTPRLQIAAGTAVLVAFSLVTMQQSAAYQNDETLWRDTASKNPNAWIAWNYLGFYAQGRGDQTQAMRFYTRSIELQPNFEAHFNLAKLFAYERKYDAALTHYQKAISLKPDLAVAYTEMGIVLSRQGKMELALSKFHEALNINPASIYTRSALAATLQMTGQTREATRQYQEVLRTDPDRVQALMNLASILASDPDSALRNGPEAVRLAERACQLTRYEDAGCVSTLSTAYAETGRFDEASNTIQKAIGLCTKRGDEDGVRANQALLKLFLDKQVYRSSASTPSPN